MTSDVEPVPIRGPAWISVEGVDGVGKTTLCRLLERVHPEWTYVPEFGESTLGSFLSEQVAASPHFIARSELAQSLLFLAEYIDRVDTLVIPALARGEVVVTDRGNRSKYVYQLLVLCRRYSAEAAAAILDAIFGELPDPTHVVVLTAPLDEIERRVSSTRHAIDPRERDFLEAASALFASTDESRSRTVFVDTARHGPEATLRSVLKSFASHDHQP